MGTFVGIVVVVVILYFILSRNLRGRPRGQGISTQPPREAALLTKLAEVEASGELVEEADKEVLRFFKVPIKGLSQTTARAEVALSYRQTLRGQQHGARDQQTLYRRNTIGSSE